jgi:hypothetical protein
VFDVSTGIPGAHPVISLLRNNKQCVGHCRAGMMSPFPDSGRRPSETVARVLRCGSRRTRRRPPAVDDAYLVHHLVAETSAKALPSKFRGC